MTHLLCFALLSFTWFAVGHVGAAFVAILKVRGNPEMGHLPSVVEVQVRPFHGRVVLHSIGPRHHWFISRIGGGRVPRGGRKMYKRTFINSSVTTRPHGAVADTANTASATNRPSHARLNIDSAVGQFRQGVPGLPIAGSGKRAQTSNSDNPVLCKSRSNHI